MGRETGSHRLLLVPVVKVSLVKIPKVCVREAAIGAKEDYSSGQNGPGDFQFMPRQELRTHRLRPFLQVLPPSRTGGAIQMPGFAPHDPRCAIRYIQRAVLCQRPLGCN